MSSIQEARNLWTLITDAEVSEQRAVLATLVRVNGSAYRRPGAKMVKREDGRMQGTLSGGCLEGDLFLHAQRVMKTHEPCLQHYDLTEDDMWGLGIGCKGRVDIWLEPIRLSDPFWTAFNECVHREEPVIWGAELPSGRRFLFLPLHSVEKFLRGPRRSSHHPRTRGTPGFSTDFGGIS